MRPVTFACSDHILITAGVSGEGSNGAPLGQGFVDDPLPDRWPRCVLSLPVVRSCLPHRLRRQRSRSWPPGRLACSA